MRNARLDEAQAGIKIAGENTNNLRYADDTTLMAESEEELKSLLMKLKEESEKLGLKQHSENWDLAFGTITSLAAQTVKTSAYNVGDPGSIPGLRRSPGEGNGNPLQSSCLENPMEGGSW